MEYTRYGDKILQRRSATAEWKEVPADDLAEAKKAVEEEEAFRGYNKTHREGGVKIKRAGEKEFEDWTPA